MRRILTVMALALTLSGCATGFGTYKNPVDRTTLTSAESAYGVALTAAVAYRKLCADKVIARAKCAPVVVRLQAADKKVQVALTNLRTFVKNNPTLDAVSLIMAAKDAMDDFRAIANAEGVQ